MLRRFFFVVFVLGIAGTSAVPAGGESIFSSLGLGECTVPAGARGAAMGGTGISLADSLSASFLNPATAVLLHRVMISVVFSPEVRYADGPPGAGKNWSSRLEGVKVVFPFPRSVALSAGFLLWGDMNSRARWSGRISSQEYLGTYEREGGMFSVPCHLSVGFRDRLMLSGGVDMVQVSSREIWGKDFLSSEYQDSEDVLRTEFSGPRPSFSLLLHWADRWRVGLVASGAADLEGTLVTEPISGKEFRTNSALHLPASIGAGLSVQPRRGWTVAVEGSRTSWGDLRIADGAPLPDRASGRVAVGLERISGRRTGTWLSRLPLRLGYRWESQPFDWPPGEPVISQMFTLGTGFLLKEKSSRLDLALAVGRVGELSKNGAEERVIRVLFTFTASERWQRKRQTHY